MCEQERVQVIYGKAVHCNSMEAEMTDFFHQIVDQAQMRSVRQLRTGSSVEFENCPSTLQLYQLDSSNFDVDTMYYCTNRYAFPRDKSVPEGYNGTVLRICTDGMHAGYARLLDNDTGLEFQHEKIRRHFDVFDDPVSHGPAQLFNSATNLKQYMPSLSSDEIDATLDNIIQFQDRVSAIHCPYWPAEVSEWITRTRHHGCPSKSVIKQVVRYGCDFVGVAHKLSPNRNGKNEWRFSFSQPELVIIRSWTGSQRIVYRALWIIHKIVQKRVNEPPGQESVLCTYYFKTFMLWACEQLPPKFWTDSSLVDTVRHMLITMCLCLIIRRCPNYFIPSNNMMDHMRTTNTVEELCALRALHENVGFISKMTLVCSVVWYANANERCQARLPAWIFQSYKILNRIYHIDDNFSKLYCRQYSATLSAALKGQFADIYNALCCHQKAKNNGVRLRKYKSNLQDAKEHFVRATTLSDSTEFLTVNCNFLMELIPVYFIKYKATESTKHTVYHNNSYDQIPVGFSETAGIMCTKNKNSKRLLYNRTETESKDIRILSKNGSLQSVKSQFITTHRAYKMNPTAIFEKFYYRDWPGRSPTVNISWFIAKAYLANLYYTTLHDHQATVSTCDDIIQVYKQSFANRMFAEEGLPVLISTQWTAVYDEEIQAVLGFYSLSAFVRSKAERRSVQLGVCPVQFALYFKLRSDMEYDSGKNYEELVKKHCDHVKECNMNFMIKNGTQAILLSFMLSMTVLFGKKDAIAFVKESSS